MIINSLELSNFKSHPDTKIGFGTGINVILGENGAGKTSILEGISYALFKEYGGNIENLVRRGQQGMSVELVFTSQGRKYRVVRSRAKGGSAAKIYFVDGTGEEKLLREGDSGVDKEIEEILGIDRYLFTNAVYVRQGEIARFLTARPSEKKQLIGKLLGIDVLDKVWERMRIVFDVYNGKKARIEGELSREDEIKERREELRVEYNEVKERIARTAKNIETVASDLGKSESEETKLGLVEKEYTELGGSLASLNSSIGREEDRLVSLRKEFAEIERARNGLKEIDGKFSSGILNSLKKEINTGQKNFVELNEKTGKLRGRISEMKNVGGKMEKLGNRCPLCGSELTPDHRMGLARESESKIRETEEDIRKLQSDMDKLEKGLKELKKRRDELEMADKRHGELSVIAGRYEPVKKEMEQGRKIIGGMTSKKSRIEIKIKGISGRIDDLEKAKGRVRVLRSELGALKEAKGRQDGKLHELGNALDRIKSESAGIREKKTEHGKLVEFIKNLNMIRSLFDKSGMQKDLRMRSGPAIEEHMKEFFREFNFDYSDISLDENYEVKLYSQYGESTTDMISGGEKIAVALAMRLGIARTLAGGSAESMLLDEPTIFLDNQRRRDLIEVLKKLSIMPQLIVVTHDTALEEAADKISVIKKEKGASFIEKF
jgi:exonuclease SbcC